MGREAERRAFVKKLKKVAPDLRVVNGKRGGHFKIVRPDPKGGKAAYLLTFSGSPRCQYWQEKVWRDLRVEHGYEVGKRG